MLIFSGKLLKTSGFRSSLKEALIKSYLTTESTCLHLPAQAGQAGGKDTEKPIYSARIPLCGKTMTFN
jgi:hypothetical protein